jgi:hypothetical protein
VGVLWYVKSTLTGQNGSNLSVYAMGHPQVIISAVSAFPFSTFSYAHGRWRSCAVAWDVCVMQFPHHSTAQVLFDRDTFWAYNELGVQSAASLFRAIHAHPGVPSLVCKHSDAGHSLQLANPFQIKPYPFPHHSAKTAVSHTHTPLPRPASFRPTSSLSLCVADFGCAFAQTERDPSRMTPSHNGQSPSTSAALQPPQVLHVPPHRSAASLLAEHQAKAVAIQSAVNSQVRIPSQALSCIQSLRAVSASHGAAGFQN